MNTITIALCQEDRERLDKIIEALGQSRTMTATPTVVQEAPTSESMEEPVTESEAQTAAMAVSSRQ